MKDSTVWVDQSSGVVESHGDSGYHSNNSSASRTPKSAYSSQKNPSYSAVKVCEIDFINMEHVWYGWGNHKSYYNEYLIGTN